MEEAKVQPEDLCDVELLKDERGGLLMEHGITTLTFYQGDPTAAAQALRQQLASVVAANPWLAGRLVKKTAGGQVKLRHPAAPAAAALDAMFAVAPAAADGADRPALKFISLQNNYVEMCTELYKDKGGAMVGTGYSLLDSDAPVAMVTVLGTAPGEFALVFSLSHAIADGRTYYEVLRMLQPGAAVRSLSSARVQGFSEAMRDKCGRRELAWADKPWTQIMYTVAMMFNPKPRCYAFYLDEGRLAAAKAAAAAEGGVPYVTTNDVLTSGFFTACRARVGMMGLDCRGRLGILEAAAAAAAAGEAAAAAKAKAAAAAAGAGGADLAGNYVTALVLGPDVFETPATLRQMYSPAAGGGGGALVTTRRPLPSCCCGGQARFAMATNWASFAGGGGPALEGCARGVHLPVMNPAYCAYDLLVPFAAGGAPASPEEGKGEGGGGGRRAVLVWAVSADEAALRAALPLGDPVSERLFPPPAPTAAQRKKG